MLPIQNNLVSIIITTKNEEKNIGRLLLSIQKQIYQHIETILIDNNSTDKTIEIARKYKIKTALFGPERSSQRNYGAKISQGGFILFLDADMRLSENVVTDCVKQVSENNKIGAIVIPEESIAVNFWEKVKAFERSFYNEKGDNSTDAARFFRKNVFNKVGGYDESITGPEDWDLPENVKKLNYKIGRSTEVIYHYERISSIFSLARKKYYYALKAHKYLKKQSISIFSAKTIYFLRPVFYRNWKKLLTHPILSLAMIVMLLVEILAGGMGYIIGKFHNK